MLILKGKVKEADTYLSFPFTILGRVIKGQGLGSILGFPTANLTVENEIIPAFGVYTVKARFSKKVFMGLCYIGDRPTFKTNHLSKKTSFEIHILDFKKSLYGKKIEVEFVKRLRPQNKFSNLQKLVEQIKKDIKKARHFLSTSTLL